MSRERRRILCSSLAMAIAIALLSPASGAVGQLTSVLVASGFTQPIAFVQDPSRTDTQYVVEQTGRIFVLQYGTVRQTPFLDLSAVVLDSGEQGLLGFALAPDYATSGRSYVNFID